MSVEPATWAAVLTPPGRGAVATIAVWGSDAANSVASHFQSAADKPLRDQPLRRIVFGRWGNAGGEELVVVRRDAETVEIHCHGGVAACNKILCDLRQAGCQIVAAEEFARREFDDPIQRAAFALLQQATTTRTAQILLDQLHGALRRELDQLQRLVEDNRLDAARQLADLLVGRAQLGLHLTTPYRVVIAGPPNVGKSSLINALVGYERAIVFDQPGTTRDVVTALTSFDGWPVELCDTAGLRASDDPLESAGVELARQQMAAADCIVLVFEATQPWTSEHEQLAQAWHRAIIVHNKCDLAPVSDLPPQGLPVSALTGAGLPQLIEAIVRYLVPAPPQPGEGVPFTPDQVELITTVAASATLP